MVDEDSVVEVTEAVEEFSVVQNVRKKYLRGYFSKNDFFRKFCSDSNGFRS